LMVAQSSINLQLIPDSSVFKPGLPFSFLVVTETPDNQPVDANIDTTVTYSNSKFEVISTDKKTVQTVKGKAILNITPPADAIALTIEALELTLSASAPIAQATKVLQASYSPSGNFIHLEQTSSGTPDVGQKIAFKINSTSQTVNFYYEVIARGKIVFSTIQRIRIFHSAQRRPWLPTLSYWFIKSCRIVKWRLTICRLVLPRPTPKQ